MSFLHPAPGLLLLALLAVPIAHADIAADCGQRSIQVELPGQEHNRLKTSMAGVGCWFWVGSDFEPEGYKSFIDLYAKHTNLRLLTTSIRHDRWVGDPAVHAQVKNAAEYARGHGMGIVFDLDVRHSREQFRKQFPDDQQELVRLRETDLAAEGNVSIAIEGIRLGDHYTFGPAPDYDSYASRLLRVYSYAEIHGLPTDVRDITARCNIAQSDGKLLRVTIPSSAADLGRKACVLAAFTLFTPDVFSPNLPAFEKNLLQQYADVPLAGACKDEWGFPGRFGPSPGDLWYSEAMAAAYAARRPGRDLARDLFLMFRGEHEMRAGRVAAINHYMRMAWQKCAELENSYYDSIKEIFGGQAMAMTHPTWYPYPNANEIFKNGLHWWAAKRDVAQTDESTPYAVRTALAKKWHSPLWVNMYYNNSTAAYGPELWQSVLGGGRINYHQVFPYPDWLTSPDWNKALLTGKLMRAEARVQLLNHISTQAIDCPVAVVFGHAAATHWTAPGFADVGMKVADKLWESGYYADLIPTSEIAEGALKTGEDGSVQYGPQRYKALILHHPEYEGRETLDFLKRAEAGTKTRIFRVGEWNVDFEGNPIDLSSGVKPINADSAAEAVITLLKADGIEPHTPGMMKKSGFGSSVAPGTSGRLRLLDGTVIHASGTHDVMGDPLQIAFPVNGHDVSFDAIGIAAVRLDTNGHLAAMAAGGLRSFQGGGIRIDLPERTDIALWQDKNGEWQGILLGHEGPLPESLAALGKNWTRLRLPVPLR
jgi:hypothetical protein